MLSQIRSRLRRSAINKFLFELGFWIHFVIMLLIFIAPFLLPLWLIVIGYVIYDFHLYIFKGCVISVIQRKFGIIDNDEEYYQALSRRLFKKSLTYNQLYLVSRVAECYVLLTSVLVFLFNQP